MLPIGESTPIAENVGKLCHLAEGGVDQAAALDKFMQRRLQLAQILASKREIAGRRRGKPAARRRIASGRRGRG
jgi:hypothetical protein